MAENSRDEEELVSVIVPIFNGDSDLERCITSLLRQTYVRIEILLIDDGSTDDTKQICLKYQKLDERVQYHTQSNRGVSSARNNGIKKAQGRYICFVDHDDQVETNHIAHLVNMMSYTQSDLAVCGWEKNAVTGEVVERSPDIHKIMSKEEALKCLLSLNGFQGYPVNKIYRTKVIKENNLLFDEDISIFEDLLFLVGYILKCDYVIVDTLATYHYILHDSSSRMQCSASTSFNKKWLSEIDALDKILQLLKGGRLSHLARARRALSSTFYLKRMYRLDYKDVLLEKRLRENIRRDILCPFVCRQGDIRWKITLLLCAISPKLEYTLHSLFDR